MKRLSIILALLILGLIVFGQSTDAQAPAPKAAEPKKAEPKSAEKKIQNAMGAAPRAISKGATILDFPAKPGGEMVVLRKGTNDWTCIVDDPSTPANDPMCMDKMSMQWAQAWMSKGEPKLSAVGIGYMLQGGGSPSNTDPFAKMPPAGQKWMKEAPHVMVFPVGKLDPKVYGTDPGSGAPWIMWAGTPYEHLMVPVK